MAGLNLLSVLGGIGGGMQQIPGLLAQQQQRQLNAQRIQQNAQEMENQRLSQGWQQIQTLSTIGSQMPTLTTSPGYANAWKSAFQNMGMDAPMDEKGNPMVSQTANPAVLKNLANPDNHKLLASTPATPEARQPLWTSWGGMGTAPDWFTQGVGFTPTPAPAGGTTALSKLVENVQGGGDLASSVGQVKTLYDMGQLGQGDQGTTALNDAVNSLVDAAASKQAATGVAQKDANLAKTKQEIVNLVQSGKYTDSEINHILAETGLVKLQQKTEAGKPALQQSEIDHNVASTAEAFAAARKDDQDTAKTMLETGQLATKIAWDQKHGMPAGSEDIVKLQAADASISNQIKQWVGTKVTAQKDLQALQNAIDTNSGLGAAGPRKPDPKNPGKYLPSASDQASALQLHKYYTTANEQLMLAQRRQQQIAPLIALPNGQRQFSVGQHELPPTKINPANGKTYYLHPGDNKYYLTK